MNTSQNSSSSNCQVKLSDVRVKDCRIDIAAVKIDKVHEIADADDNEDSSLEYVTAEESLNESETEHSILEETTEESFTESTSETENETVQLNPNKSVIKKITQDNLTLTENSQEVRNENRNTVTSLHYTTLNDAQDSADDTASATEETVEVFTEGSVDCNTTGESVACVSEQSTSVGMTESNIVAYSSSITGSEDETGNISILNPDENTEIKEEASEETMDINDDNDIEEVVEEERNLVTYRKSGENIMLPIRVINPHLICMLCAGYFIEATTINECLHTFCKSCIVRCLLSSKYCPACGILVHETEPLSKLRLDRTMQDIMTTLLPHLEEDEDHRRKEFYQEYKKEKKETDQKAPKPSKAVSSVKYDFQPPKYPYREDEQINLYLRLKSVDGVRTSSPNVQEITSNRYARCSSRLQIQHVKKLLCNLYAIKKSNYLVEVECENVVLNDQDSLRKVYVVEWRRKPYNPGGMYLLKVWNMFKVNSEDIRTTPLTHFTPCSSVSIVNFEQPQPLLLHYTINEVNSVAKSFEGVADKIVDNDEIIGKCINGNNQVQKPSIDTHGDVEIILETLLQQVCG